MEKVPNPKSYKNLREKEETKNAGLKWKPQEMEQLWAEIHVQSLEKIASNHGRTINAIKYKLAEAACSMMNNGATCDDASDKYGITVDDVQAYQKRREHQKEIALKKQKDTATRQNDKKTTKNMPRSPQNKPTPNTVNSTTICEYRDGVLKVRFNDVQYTIILGPFTLNVGSEEFLRHFLKGESCECRFASGIVITYDDYTNIITIHQTGQTISFPYSEGKQAIATCFKFNSTQK